MTTKKLLLSDEEITALASAVQKPRDVVEAICPNAGSAVGNEWAFIGMMMYWVSVLGLGLDISLFPRDLVRDCGRRFGAQLVAEDGNTADENIHIEAGGAAVSVAMAIIWGVDELKKRR